MTTNIVAAEHDRRPLGFCAIQGRRAESVERLHLCKLGGCWRVEGQDDRPLARSG